MNNIDILEEFINDYKKVQEKYKDDEIQAEIERSCYFEEVPYQAIETLIVENKELKEKIKEINEEYNAEQKHEMENTIPKSKVEKKIEELSGMVEVGDITREMFNRIEYAIEVLLELLDERNNTDE